MGVIHTVHHEWGAVRSKAGATTESVESALVDASVGAFHDCLNSNSKGTGAVRSKVYAIAESVESTSVDAFIGVVCCVGCD